MRSPSRSTASGWVVVALLVVCLAGCGGGEEEATERGTSSETAPTSEATVTTTPVTTTPEVTASTTTAAPVADNGPASCVGVPMVQSQWELAEASVGWVSDGSGLSIGATARGGNWEGLDWGYSFELADLTYVAVLGTY
ncbi:hypothetical protein B7486_64320, partial [cyanobacterium TDX16]